MHLQVAKQQNSPKPSLDLITNFIFSRNNIFVEHVTKVANYASARYGVKPIIWDDMLRNFMEVSKFVYSMASKPVYIRWIKTDSEP